MNKYIDVLEARIFNVEEAGTWIWKRGKYEEGSHGFASRLKVSL